MEPLPPIAHAGGRRGRGSVRPGVRMGSSSHSTSRVEKGSELTSALRHDPAVRPGLMHWPSDLREPATPSLLRRPREGRKLPAFPQEVSGKLEPETGRLLDRGSRRWAGGAELLPGDVPAVRCVTSQTRGGERKTILGRPRAKPLSRGVSAYESPHLRPAPSWGFVSFQ